MTIQPVSSDSFPANDSQPLLVMPSNTEPVSYSTHHLAKDYYTSPETSILTILPLTSFP
jgi:hypothetical protein